MLRIVGVVNPMYHREEYSIHLAGELFVGKRYELLRSCLEVREQYMDYDVVCAMHPT